MTEMKKSAMIYVVTIDRWLASAQLHSIGFYLNILQDLSTSVHRMLRIECGSILLIVHMNVVK